MKLNFDQVLLDFDGEQVADVEDDVRAMARVSNALVKAKREELARSLVEVANSLDNKFRALTLRKACIVAIGAGVQEEKSPEKVVAYYELGNLLKDGGEIEITTEQATMLKTVVAKTFSSPMVSGQACKMLNG